MKSFLSTSLFFLFLTTQIASAGQFTWTGNNGNTFFDPDNWDGPGGYPGANDTVIFEEAPNNPILDSNVTVYYIQMLANSMLDLDTFTLIVEGYADMQGGQIVNGELIIRGESVVFNGTEFTCKISVYANYIDLLYGTFSNKCHFELLGSNNCSSFGLCVFSDSVSIVNSGSGEWQLGANQFDGDLTLTVTSDGPLYMSVSGETYYNGNLFLNNTGSNAIIIGGEGGVSFLADGKVVAVGDSGYTDNDLFLTMFTQLGEQDQQIELTGNSNLFLQASQFNGSITLSASGILCSSSLFNGDVIMDKTGSESNYWAGSNYFYGITSITNSSPSGTDNVMCLSTSDGNIFYNDAGFYSSNQNLLEVDHSAHTDFYGDLYVNSGSILFHNSVHLKGNQSQVVSGTVPIIFDNLTIQKSDAGVTAVTTIVVTGTLTFNKGNLITNSEHLLVFNAGSSASGASDSSFVAGPVNKIGNTAFEFPVGKATFYKPTTISATSSTANQFLAEYINLPQPFGVNRDSTIDGISYCDYWILNRPFGSEKVSIKIGWNSDHCGIMDSARITIARWDTLWHNMNVDLFSGTFSTGYIVSEDSLDAEESLICFAYKKIPVSPNPVNLTVTLDINTIILDHFFGLNGANTIKDGASWDNANMRNAITRMQPSTMRFPGGTVGNWWDWRKGWFVDRDYSFQTCPGLPASYENLPQEDNHLSTFAEALGVIGSKPMFMLNMMTSNLPYQLAMLHEAEILGMPVNWVELGNEFYRDSWHECEPNEVFPTANDYATESGNWISAIGQRFAGSEVAVIGADSRDMDDPRQFDWNTNLNISSITPEPDAATLHTYFGAGTTSTLQTCELTDYGSTNNANDLFLSGFDFMTAIDGDEWLDLDQNELWLTEYNLWDGDRHYIHGSWAHAMKTASMTFKMLERGGYIRKINCHTMVANAVFGSFFPGTTDGFDFNPNDPTTQNGTFCSAANLINQGFFATGPFATTSLGYALSEIGQATRFAESAKRLIFSGSVPELEIGVPAIEAWQFKDPEDNERTLVLNMSDVEITIDMTGTGISTPQLMKVVSLEGTSGTGSDRLNRFVYNNSNNKIEFIDFSTGSAMISDMQEHQFKPYSSIEEIPPFSLVHYVYMVNGVYSVTLHPSETNVCAGRKFYLYANTSPNATNFEWKDQSGTMGQTSTPFFQAEEGNGPYYVIVTYGTSGTATSNNVSITQKAIPSLTVSPSSPAFCKGGTPITLEASLSGATQIYCWIPLDDAVISSDLASQLTDEIQVAPEHTASYMVYATDGQCSVSEQVTVTVLGDIQFDPNPVTFCSSAGGIWLNPSVPAGGSYMWNDNSTAIPKYVTPASAQSYTLTVTNNVTCSVSATVDVLPIECCSSAYDVEFTDYTDAQAFIDDINTACSCVDLQTDGTYLITGPLDIYIEQTLFIDLDISLINVNLEFAERGALIVDSYRTLTMNTCTLSTCAGKMWQGIEVLEKGRVITTDNTTNSETVISEAYQGILFRERTNAILRRTRFQNNYIGLRSFGAPLNLMDNYLKIMSRCTFESTATLLNTYANIPALPANGVEGYTGIFTENDNISINSGNANFPSEFDNLSNGIVATNSILNITNTSFTDMEPESPYNWLNIQGFGINISGWERFSSLNLVGLGKDVSSNPTFSDCITGISSQTSSVSVVNSKFDNIIHGIRSELPFFQAISIVDNSITAEQTGIGIFGADFSMAIDVRDNVINIDNVSLDGNIVHGIELNNMMIPFQWRQCRITCNQINMGNATRGISISGFQASNPDRILNVAENTILIDDNSLVSDGIYFENVSNGFVQSNIVSGDDPSDANNTNAIQFIYSPDNVIRLNETTNTRVGLQFIGACNSMDNILGNQMGDHFHGMELQASGVLGTQDYTGNVWTGYDGSPLYEEDGSFLGNFIGAWADPSMSPFDLQQSQFKINSSSAITHFPYYTPINTGWFTGDVGLNQTFSYENNCAILPQDPEVRLGYLDSLIVMDTLTSPVYQEELRIVASIQLREKLKLMKQSEELDSLFNAYFNSFSSTILGKTCRYRDSLAVLSPLGSDSIGFIMNRDSTIHDKLTAINDILESDNEIPDTLIADYNMEIRTLNDVWASSFSQSMSAINTDVYDLIENISTSNVIETNFKEAYLGFFYHLLERDSLNSILEALIPIAQQCVFEGGPGVIISRNMLRMLKDTTIFDDNLLCGNLRQIQTLHMPGEIKDHDVKIFPNPTTGMITIALSDNWGKGEFKLEVSDLTGKAIYLKKIKEYDPIFQLDLSSLENGTYFIKIATREALIHLEKLAIIK